MGEVLQFCGVFNLNSIFKKGQTAKEMFLCVVVMSLVPIIPQMITNIPTLCDDISAPSKRTFLGSRFQVVR